MSDADSPQRSQPLRVAFAGTPEFAAQALRAVLAHGFEVPLVLTQPDRPAGRGLKQQPSAVKTVALSHELPVCQARSLRLDGKYPDDARAAQAALIKARPDVMVVAAYGLILPGWVLALPQHGCLNIHASLLPRWRGAAPIHRAIEAGDQRTGITLMQMDVGLDTGDMLRSVEEPISPQDTTSSLHDRLAAIGAALTVEVLNALRANRLIATPQPAHGICYAHKIEKSEAWVDWTWPADVIERRIRAFDPFPGAATHIGGETVKIWRAALDSGVGLPGEVIASSPAGLTVACGQGALRLLELQRPGGKRISAAQFLQAQALPLHSVLGLKGA